LIRADQVNTRRRREEDLISEEGGLTRVGNFAYRRVPRFFEEASLAKADGTYTKLMATLAKADVLILDDLGLGTLREAQRYDLLEVLEDRYGDRSTIVTSQLPISGWHDWVNDPTVADAILDRLVHNAYKIELTGASGRKERAKS
jgi:DNA replication protein DnaC